MITNTQIHTYTESLAKTFVTQKGKTEFALLMNLRMACLVARGESLSASVNVQARLKDIEQYVNYHQPSQAFYQRYMRGRSEICSGVLLSIDSDCHASIVRASCLPKNVINLIGDRHAANH